MFTEMFDSSDGIVAYIIQWADHYIGPGQDRTEPMPAVIDTAIVMNKCTVLPLYKFPEVRTLALYSSDIEDTTPAQVGMAIACIPDGPRFSVFQLPTIWKFSVNKERN